MSSAQMKLDGSVRLMSSGVPRERCREEIHIDEADRGPEGSYSRALAGIHGNGYRGARTGRQELVGGAVPVQVCVVKWNRASAMSSSGRL